MLRGCYVDVKSRKNPQIGPFALSSMTPRQRFLLKFALAELSDRAAESVKSEVRLREVQTELSVAQASTDLLATGVLDYSVASDGEGDAKDDGKDDDAQSDIVKAAP